MTILIRFSIVCYLSLTFALSSFGQKENPIPLFDYTNGIGITLPDSSFSINFRFRTQLRSAYSTISESDFSASDIEARVRRLRMRFDGFLINPKINYNVQLSFSRGDMDWVDNDNSEFNSSPNIVRDAVLRYKLNKHLTFSFGQSKLPGNRQRVVSSGQLQFADRAITNAVFNIDRDFGLQFAYDNNVSNLWYSIKGALTSGEGRNSVKSDQGLAYTGRVEIMPLGKFSKNGDYFEGDLAREPKPKIAFGATYHYNESAIRTAGTLGKDLYEHRNIQSFIADVLFKYKGYAISAEFLNRNCDSPITTNLTDQKRVVFVGEGKMMQVSKLFQNDFEIAARYAVVNPFTVIESIEKEQQEIGLGISKYVNNHKLKIQGNIFHYQSTDPTSVQTVKQNWAATFQIELGI